MPSHLLNYLKSIFFSHPMYCRLCNRRNGARLLLSVFFLYLFLFSKEQLKRLQDKAMKTTRNCFEVYANESYSRSVNLVRTLSYPLKLSHPVPNLYEKELFAASSVSSNFQGMLILFLPVVFSVQ